MSRVPIVVVAGGSTWVPINTGASSRAPVASSSALLALEPAASVESDEAVGLAFIAAMQLLAPKQPGRAVPAAWPARSSSGLTLSHLPAQAAEPLPARSSHFLYAGRLLLSVALTAAPPALDSKCLSPRVRQVQRKARRAHVTLRHR
jgi:hypothetical protein